MRDYILAALMKVYPGATVSAYTFDGGQHLRVIAGGRRAFITAEWGDNPESVLAVILDRLARQ